MNAPNTPVDTTLWDILHALHEVTNSEEEVRAVLETMIAQGRLGLVGEESANGA